MSSTPHFPFSTVCRRKTFKCGVTGYCAAYHLFTPSSLVPRLSDDLNAYHYCPSFKKGKKKGGGGREGRTGKVTRGLRDKNQADFYLGRAPGADSSRLLLPSNREKRDEGCNVAARIDSRHNLFLSALAQRIVFLHRSTRWLFKEGLPATFHAIMLRSHILTATLSHYF